MTERDDRFTEDVRRVLIDGEHDIDPQVLDALGNARRAAVGQAERPAMSPVGSWAPVGALAATVLAVGVAYVGTQPTDPRSDGPALSTVLADEVEQQAASDLDLLEDLEFYAWMALEADPDSAG